MGDHAQAVGAEKNRAAVFLAVGGVDPERQRRGGFPALFRLAQTAGNQHHRFRRARLDDFIHQAVHRVGRDGNDQEIELVLQRLQAFSAFHAVDLLLAGANDSDALLAVAAADQIGRMIRLKFMPLAETPMMPMDAGWISLSILWIGRLRRGATGLPNYNVRRVH